MTQHNARHETIRHDMARYGTARCGVAWQDTWSHFTQCIMLNMLSCMWHLRTCYNILYIYMCVSCGMTQVLCAMVPDPWNTVVLELVTHTHSHTKTVFVDVSASEGQHGLNLSQTSSTCRISYQRYQVGMLVPIGLAVAMVGMPATYETRLRRQTTEWKMWRVFARVNKDQLQIRCCCQYCRHAWIENSRTASARYGHLLLYVLSM